ncbi:hypothetical protein GJ629_02145 [Halapricum sp. CBA1109]|uniref:alkaline phosphatase family protein n=1 Tax=Halapricum sp. CBA1109 TaxID=2668068 RepID=UPI0012FAD739|nr:alkaline phosphatase family protein [Halapricum sp. CBA1109]MUV88840.1 hypothetical protein [Halapricum sp. CBA1109]
MTARTIVFGLDGACFDLIDEWLDSGRLDTLSGLLDRGVASGLRSCVPATTPPAWSSLTTGVNPGKHGVFGFYERHPDSYHVTPVSDETVRARRLWDYATANDRTSLVVNVPVTHPGREIDGALVPGYLATDTPDTYPPDVLERVGMDDYRVYAPSEAADVSEGRLLEEWRSLTDSRRDLTLALMDAYEWDLCFVEFQKTDGAVHKFDDRENVRRIFERVDDCMGDILDAAGGDPNVVVVSDHGIGQPKQWSVALNTWLAENGYAETTVGSERKSAWMDRAMGAEADGRRSVAGRLLAALGSVGVTKQRLERLLATAGLYDLATRLAPAGLGAGVDEEVIDYERSRAFYQGIGFSGVDVGVVINAETYYDDGIVDEGAYDDLRSELIDRLAALEGPDGTPAFTEVKPREDVYEGPYVADAPDIVLHQHDDYVIGSAKPRGKTFIPADAGRIDHTDTGLLVAAGPDIDSEWSPGSTPSILDVTPTLLHLHDIPLDERFDGAPLSLSAVDHDPRWTTYEGAIPGTAAEMTSAEEQALEDRLKGMGYLE